MIEIIVLYVISIGVVELWAELAYSKGGVFEEIVKTKTRYFLRFCPIINSFYALLLWVLLFPLKT